MPFFRSFAKLTASRAHAFFLWIAFSLIQSGCSTGFLPWGNSGGQGSSAVGANSQNPDPSASITPSPSLLPGINPDADPSLAPTATPTPEPEIATPTPTATPTSVP